MAVFTNTTLEGCFKRIANATRSLCGLSGTLTLKQIHTALLSKSGLSRKTTPVTPGDYLKGIAVCARKINGRSDYLTGSCTLAEIATCLENPAATDPGTLSASLVYYSSSHTMRVTLNTSAFKGTITSITYVLMNGIVQRDSYTTAATSVVYPRTGNLASGTYNVKITVSYKFNGENRTTTLTTAYASYTAPSSGGGSGGESEGGTTVSIRVANGSGGYKTVQIAQSEIASTYPYKVTCQWAEGDHSSYGIDYYYDEDTFAVTCSCGNVLGMVAGEPYGET